MASNPPAACCAIGVKHEGEAKGQFEQIGDGPYYPFSGDRLQFR